MRRAPRPTLPRRGHHAGRPPGGGGQAKVPTRDELTRVDKCLTGTRHEARNRALFYLQLATGMRVGELARAGIHPRVIQKRAGHASLNTTMRYIDVTPAEERKAVRAVSF